MIKVYYLRLLKNEAENREYIEGEEFISHAICEVAKDPNVWRVVIEENTNLDNLALKIEEPSLEDVKNYNTLPSLIPSRNFEAEIDEIKARLKNLEARTPKTA